MASLHKLNASLAIYFLFILIQTIQVTSLGTINTSKCISVCGDDRKTTTSDLVCPDSSYNSSSNGETMKTCLLCQSTGTAYISDERNDIYTFLYNQKYTLQTCLFDKPADVSLSGCEGDCLPLKSVFEEPWYKTNYKRPIYEYCNNTGFNEYAGSCGKCLWGKSGSYVLGNYLDTMVSACETKPNASKGEIIKLNQPLFVVPNTTTTDTESSGLSSGAKIGIGVGVGVGGVILLAAAGWVFCLARKRRKARAKQAVYETEQVTYAPPDQAQMQFGMSEVPAEETKKVKEMPVSETGPAVELDGNMRKERPPVELP
ncbi:hypothetical protein BDV25DRAFT_139483 [Aspergillus avenaceus]|uniref:LPXTG-domain-containing protein n=1 Tax=Aspergillus avenaceus TaxID=36643 RepID=A0A5N6TXJ4_ASPAV|nr:hypothetical protein BDV25DRAFT_139483 [Aspergillus avenaceus]